jgi:hypothetical protein
MKRLLPLLILLAALSVEAQAALTRTARGTGGNNTGATTLTVAPASNYTANSFAVLCVALDNAGSAGANKIAPPSATDSVGNVWTRQVNELYDNGAASAGVEIAIYTATVSSFTTANSLTITWLSSTSVTAKAYTLDEFTAAAGKRVVYLTGAVSAGATGTGGTITTSSITSGDAVIGAGGAEAAAASWTGDADTSNGSWTTQQTAGFGTGTSGMTVTSQTKITTGTATQTYNPTIASSDNILAWISVGERSVGTGNFLPFFQE